MRNPVRVLYVDAEPPPAELTDADDVAVSSTRTAAAARERLAADGSVDCVVSEYVLPDSDGLDLLGAVRESYPNLPFVLFTGAGSEAVASEALGRGATDYLPKEECGHELHRRVARAVAASGIEAESGLSGDQMRELTNAFPDVAFILDEAGQYLEVLSGPGTADLRTYEQEQLVGRYVHDAFEDEKADRFLDHVRTTLESGSVETIEYCTETRAGERWFEGRTAPLGSEVAGRRAVVWVARDVTDRRANERRLAARRDELETINRINGLMNGILQSLVESATREEIERTVCEGLADSEFYRFAWIGAPWGQSDRMSPSVVAGADRETVERLNESINALAEPDNWFATVAERGESQVESDVANSSVMPPDVRAELLSAGVESAAIVPLSYAGSNYGVLSVCGASPDTFGDRERSALEALGEVAAFAIDAVKNRNLLLSDTAVELEFRVPAAKSLFGRLSAELDCECRLEGFVSVSEDRLLEYVAVEDAEPSAVRGRLDAADEVEELRVVSDDESCLLEVVVPGSEVERLVKAGTVVRSASAADGEVRLRADAPSDVNVRSVVESFQLAYPDSELVSKQEVHRPVRTARELKRTLTDELTDKQRTALQAAYFAGYYDYPRGSTAEEVADSLGISSPTFHQHLRTAQRKLVGTVLD